MSTTGLTRTSTTEPDGKLRTVLYPHAQWYFLAAMVVTWIGFSQSYFAVIRTEPLLHHIHGALMGGWIALLVIQPILYQRGQLRLHRTLGRWGVYVWLPAILICGFLVDRRMLRTHNAPPLIIDQLAFLDLTSLILFPLLIALSIRDSRRVQLHARYIVCTVLLLMPPALARALFLIPGMSSFQLNVNTAEGLVILVLLVLMMEDRKSGKVRLPYPLSTALFSATAVASNYTKSWPWWHDFTGWIAGS
jgi:hypothetical protein